jgi:hypothetical protein
VEMVRFLLICALVCAFLPGAASAAGFSLTVGPPVAAGAKVTKKSAAIFAIRMEECDDLSTARVTGTAEGRVNGSRTSVPVLVDAGGSAGVYVVSQNWPAEGVWVVNVSASCGRAKAGAIVPIAVHPDGAQGFVRESLKFFPRPATNAEIEAVLKSLEKH